MNKIERMRTVIRGGVPDRIPMMIHNFLMAAREGGITMQQYRDSPDAIVRVLTQSCEKYDMDGILLDVDTALLASSCGADTIYPENMAAIVSDRQTRSIPELIAHLEGLDLESQPRIAMYLETIRKLADWGKRNEVFIRGNADQGSFSLACLLVGMNKFLMELMDEDSEAELLELMEATYSIALKMHKLCHEAGADCTSYGNSSAGSSVISPALFRKFAKPYETRLATELNALGIDTICHICGCVEPILADLAETGCRAYELDSKTDIRRTKQIAKGHFIISGNIDTALFGSGSPSDMIDATRELCELYHSEGGLIICSGCALSPGTQAENVFAFAETVKAFG